MITITLPDGSIRQFDAPPTGAEVALSISEGLARNTVAMDINGQSVDLNHPISTDSEIRLITTHDPEALTIMRHSAAHVMAQAILKLYPEAKLTIGPVVEDGFYYDIDMAPVSEDDFPKIEAEMQKIIPNPRHWIFFAKSPTRSSSYPIFRMASSHCTNRAILRTCVADPMCRIRVLSKPSS